MRTIIGHSRPPLNFWRTMRAVRHTNDNSHKKVHDVRGRSSVASKACGQRDTDGAGTDD